MGHPSHRVPTTHLDIYDHRGVIIGLVNSTALLTNPHDVAAYDKEFTALGRMAAWDDDARALFTQIAHQYRALER